MAAWLLSIPAAATEPDYPADDRLSLEQVTDGVYAIVGPLGNRSADNYGNNATFGFVVTDDGVLLIDPGGSYKGAVRIHEIIKSVTDLPIRYVVNTGSQDHRWLGNAYFKSHGAQVIASEASVRDQKERLNDIFFGLAAAAGEDTIEGTVADHADIRFDSRYTLTLGGIEFDIVHPGPAHTPGDTFVWLPVQQVVFSGDIIYTGRLLSVFDFSRSGAWVAAFEAVAALRPAHVVPGHGRPTTLDEARQSTYHYLTTLRERVRNFLDQGGEIYDVGTIDQSDFRHLENYEQLKGRNAQQVFQEMEWE